MVSSKVFELKLDPINVKHIIDSTMLMEMMVELLRLWLGLS